MQTGWEAVRFGWVAYLIPFLFVASPTLLLDGSPMAVTAAITTSLFGVWMVSAAVIGYFRRPVKGMYRALFAVAGLMMFIPAGAVPYGHIVDGLGVILGLVLVVKEYMAVPRGSPADVKVTGGNPAG